MVEQRKFGIETCCNRQRWQAPDVPVELAKRVICGCIREICFFRDRMGPKSHKFSSSLLTRHLYTRQLSCEPQTGSAVCLSFAVRNGTKRTSSSLDWRSTSIKMQAAASFAVPLCKDKQCFHGNLNKGASGSMKLNWWHATISGKQPGKQYLGYNSLECAGNILALYQDFASQLWLTAVYMINNIPTWREGRLVLVRLKDSSVIVTMNQTPKNCSHYKQNRT